MGYANKELDLTIVHARDDVEIPWYEGCCVWVAAMGEDQVDVPGHLVYEKKEANGPSEIRIWEN